MKSFETVRNIGRTLLTWTQTRRMPRWLNRTLTALAYILLWVGGIAAVGGGIVGLILVLSLFAPAIGALAGWVVGWVFDETSAKMLTLAGLHGKVAMWELGATLGFIGAFFKSSSSSVSKS